MKKVLDRQTSTSWGLLFSLHVSAREETTIQTLYFLVPERIDNQQTKESLGVLIDFVIFVLSSCFRPYGRNALCEELTVIEYQSHNKPTLDYVYMQHYSWNE